MAGQTRSGALTASLAHSSYVSVFPLPLVLVTILGLVASGDPALRAGIGVGFDACLRGVCGDRRQHVLGHSSRIWPLAAVRNVVWAS
jgi:hypothetical protein